MERLSNEAFYTSRLDDDGNEVEVTHTARTMDMPPRVTRSNHSSRESSRSLKHVNTAVYIEKNNNNEGGSRSSSVISLPSLVNSDIVPPLDLQSEECYPTRRDGYTFSYRNHYEPVKLDSNPDVAYNNWLSAKRKILSDEAERRKREQEAKNREQEERKRLSEEKYQKWLKSKQQDKSSQHKVQEKQEQRVRNKPTADELTAKAKLEEWERKKREQEERRREMKKNEEARRKRDEEKRRQLADEAWKKWIADAPNKPKPVPLNQGMDTLRGTISNIFVNPNEWRTD